MKTCYSCGQPATVLFDTVQPALAACSSCGWRLLLTVLEILSESTVPAAKQAKATLEHCTVGAC